MDGPWPVKELPEDLTSALERYDNRNSTAENQFFNRSGTLLAQPFDGDVAKAPRETALFSTPRCGARSVSAGARQIRVW